MHAWDHHRWQQRAASLNATALVSELEPGFILLGDILGRKPNTSAAAGWICTDEALEAKESFGFAFNSDCRGTSVFVPLADGKACAPQVPTTMPTYDELIGRDGVTDGNYNERLLSHVRPQGLNVLTIHAEVEGIVCAALFDEFLQQCRTHGFEIVPLGKLSELFDCMEHDSLTFAPIKGRDGMVAWQHGALVR